MKYYQQVRVYRIGFDSRLPTNLVIKYQYVIFFRMLLFLVQFWCGRFSIGRSYISLFNPKISLKSLISGVHGIFILHFTGGFPSSGWLRRLYQGLMLTAYFP